MTPDIEFSKLMQQMASGDREAFSQFAEHYRGRAYSIAYSVCHHREDAEDIVHEVFIKLMTLESSKFPASGYASWFFVLTKNTALDYLRAKRPTENIDDIQFPDAHAEKEIASLEALDEYESLVSRLSSEEKLVVGLKVLGGMKHREIASMLNKPIGTIQWIYHKAIHSLQISLSILTVFIVALVYTITQNGKAMATGHYSVWGDSLFWVGWVMVLSAFFSLYFFAAYMKRKLSHKQ